MLHTRWPDDPDTYVTATQVAAKLGFRSVKSFYQARTRELVDKGFPAPAIGRRYRAREIEAWETLNAWRAAHRELCSPANDHRSMPGQTRPEPPQRPIDGATPAHQRLADMRRRMQSA